MSSKLKLKDNGGANDPAAKLFDEAALDYRESLNCIRFLLFSARSTDNKRRLADACNRMLNAILTDFTCLQISLDELHVSKVDNGLVRSLERPGFSSGSVWGLQKVLNISLWLHVVGTNDKATANAAKIGMLLEELKTFVHKRVIEWVTGSENNFNWIGIHARWNLWFAHVHSKLGDFVEAKIELRLAAERDPRLCLCRSYSDIMAHVRNACSVERQDAHSGGDSFPLTPAPPKIMETKQHNFWIRCHDPSVFSRDTVVPEGARSCQSPPAKSPLRRAMAQSSDISIG
mmetsp:Transcript_5423/g.11118  ORF Transcript_5423/g.11118 Transcript_5423/m.11118 type:complete len:288 (+) Transcript_5423:91-954(+)|eukprot:CAMPEP_0168739434 /NCGR_PEP_ID=MMETSP0724-20121128/11462_1 /TAXON_ID=265536 /ORGANISM="Amphiprora sp., Strain CCMP467" /LENGTH=287 /DNA_ID=CAMNT_0008786839 /DNA_START=184 /DNA_END=1047 /DNA_ORIENTATION=+